jgi:hypothetical protein
MPLTRCTIEAMMATGRGRIAVLGACELNDAEVEHCCPPSLSSDAHCSVSIIISVLVSADDKAGIDRQPRYYFVMYTRAAMRVLQRVQQYPLELAVRARCYWLHFPKILANNHHGHHQPPRALLANALSSPQRTM